MAKPYDRAYFDRWYRAEGFGSPARLRRKVHHALGAAEYLLERPVRSVLDIGCGEGQWRAELRRLRPTISYVGVDPSEYAVQRYGRRRSLRLGEVGTLHTLGLRGPFDLVVAADVLPYVGQADLRRGLATIAELLGGVAYLELYSSEDAIEGDVAGMQRRRAATYRRWLAEAGLTRVGPHLYVGDAVLPTLSAFEGGLS